MTELTRKQVETMLAEATKRANEIPQEAADRENSCSACCGPYGSETWDDYADHQDRILLLGLSTVARALIAAWDREAKLREALVEIEGGAYPDHWVPQYQHCIDVASAALKS